MPEGPKLTDEQIRSVMPDWVLEAVDEAAANPPPDWAWVDVSDVRADGEPCRLEIRMDNTPRPDPDHA